MDMTQDVFYEWKNRRFIIADYVLLDEPKIVVILTDIEYWSQHGDALMAWCMEYGGNMSGMSVTFDTPEQLSWFTLRWA